MVNSAECDPSPNSQLEFPFAAARSKGNDPNALLNDPVARERIANLWNRHQQLLLELACYHLQDWDLAQEVVQDMWVDFIKSVPRFRGRCSEKTWLVQILRRCIKKEQRRTIFRRTREAILRSFERRPGGYVGSTVGSEAQWYQNPEQLLLAQECLEEIWRAGQSLPKRQAEVWFLRDVNERTAGQVSASLGLTPQNERVLLCRARQRMGEKLKGYLGKANTAKPIRTKTHDLQRS
jgi:RNA polymerase sigma-70 factor, ECF subfamily